jgi:hypothetical protein
MLAKALEFSFDARLEVALDAIFMEGGAQTGALVGSVRVPPRVWAPRAQP